MCASWRRPTRILEAAVQQRLFREDLFYRLNALSIDIPPLRERRADIPLLTDYFLDRYRDPCVTSVIRVGAGERAALLAYPWPGNVRRTGKRRLARRRSRRERLPRAARPDPRVDAGSPGPWRFVSRQHARCLPPRDAQGRGALSAAG
jgi:hypothetical protein